MIDRKPTSKRKERKSDCKSVDADVAKWMIPETISIKENSSCNVLVIVPHGYPKEDDNAELLGALLAEKLDCFAVINNRCTTRVHGRDFLGIRVTLEAQSLRKRLPNTWTL